MTVARATGHIPSVANGEDAVSYEIVPSTYVVSLDKNDNWVEGTTTTVVGSERCAVVTFIAYKVVGIKREKFSDCYWLGGNANPIASNTYYRYLSKTDTSADITLCRLEYDSNHSPKASDVLARVTVSVNRAGKDGENGKSVLCQYSASGADNSWHDGFKTGDVWMRTKTEGGSWGAAMRVVGEQGKNGEYTKYSFGISAQAETGGVGIAPTVVGGWNDAPILTTSDKPYLWMQVIKYDSNNNPGDPSYVRINGKDGANGTSVDIKGSFNSPDKLPESGAKLGDCYIINGNLWVYTAETTSGSKSGFINAGNIKGEPGTNAIQYYYHIAWCNNLDDKDDFTTSNPLGAAYTYMGICYTDSVADPSGPGAKSLYKWSKIEGKPAVTYEIALDTTSVVADGETGKFLTTNLGKFRFLRHEGNNTEPCDIYDTWLYIALFIGYDGKVLNYAGAEGSDDIYSILTDNNVDCASVAMIKFFWYDKVVQSDDYNYAEKLAEDDACGIPTSDMGINILATKTFTAVKQGTNGKRGSSGAVYRQHKGFVEASNYQYQAGGNDEQFLDVVLVGKVWYRCIKSYISKGVNDERSKPGTNAFNEYWTSADMSGFTFIATDFLLAENAQLNLLGSQEINLLDSTEDGKIFGSFRVPNGNGDDGEYALWIGGEKGKDASFSVTKDGAINAKEGRIGSFVITKDEQFLSEAGLYMGKIMDEERTDSDNYYTYGFSLSKSNLSFGISGDNVIFAMTGYGEQVKMCETSYIAPYLMDGKYFVGLRPPAFSVVKRMSDYPMAEDNIAATIEATSRSDSSCTALQLSATGGVTNYALECNKGDVMAHSGSFIGAHRPSVKTISSSTTLTESDCVVICNNTAAINITLPEKANSGRFYIIIQAGAKINFRSSALSSRGILCQHDPNSDTTYQWNMAVYFNGNWYLRGIWN